MQLLNTMDLLGRAKKITLVEQTQAALSGVAPSTQRW
jgi:hypothetical protein